jgi:ATP-dependent DNA ligase
MCSLSAGTAGTTPKRFAELADALAGLKPKTVVLDGEVAVFDRELVSRLNG